MGAAAIGQGPTVGLARVCGGDLAALGETIERAAGGHVARNQRDILPRRDGNQRDLQAAAAGAIGHDAQASNARLNGDGGHAALIEREGEGRETGPAGGIGRGLEVDVIQHVDGRRLRAFHCQNRMRAVTKSHGKRTPEETAAANAQHGVVGSARGSRRAAHEDIHEGVERAGVENELALAAAILAHEERILHQDDAATRDFHAGPVAGVCSNAQIARHPGARGHTHLAVASYFRAGEGIGQAGGPARRVIPGAAASAPSGGVLRERRPRGEQ